MQSNRSSHPSSPESNPGHSTDWRHLLPLVDESKTLVLCQACGDIVGILHQAGIPMSVQQSDFTSLSNLVSKTVDAIVIPFGFPENLHLDFFHLLRGILQESGVLLIGFENRWKLQRVGSAGIYVSMPRQLTYLLRQAGFASIDLYGVIPDLQIPEYIFPLTPQSLSFVLQQRYKRNLPLGLLRRLFTPALASQFSGFMPSYYAIAKA